MTSVFFFFNHKHSYFFFNNNLLKKVGEGNGNPLQYSCLENLWTEESDGLQFHGITRVRQDLATKPSPLKKAGDIDYNQN